MQGNDDNNNNNRMPAWSVSAQRQSDSNPSGILRVGPHFLDLEHGSCYALVQCSDGTTISCRNVLLGTIEKFSLYRLAGMLGMETVTMKTPNLLSVVCTQIWQRYFSTRKKALQQHTSAHGASRENLLAQGSLNPPPTPDRACSQNNERAGEPSNIWLKLGDTVVLKHQGKGEKRKFNGEKATVTAYPEEGDEMTVFVRSKRLKWNKRDVALPLPELELDTWSRIFQFLGTTSGNLEDELPAIEEGELLWVDDAVKVHTQLASVCRLWRGICNQSLPAILGRLNVDLDALATTKKIVPTLQWCCKHTMQVGILKLNASSVEDLPLLEDFLVNCDTTRLTIVRVRLP